MEKQSYVSAWQVIAVLLVTRILFSTAYIAGLAAGTDVQDILLAVPVNFLLNFIVAIPVLVLLRRHPGKDLVECATHAMGRPMGAVIGVFYTLCFLFVAVLTQATFQIYYVNSIIPESSYYAIAVPLLLVCIYGAIKGAECILRFGGAVLIVYILVLILIMATLLSQFNLHYFTPVLYNGPSVLFKAAANGFTSNLQIVYLAFFAPFLKSGTNLTKLYVKYNLLAALLFMALEAGCVGVLGPYLAKQNFPLQTLASLSQVSVFERLDAFDMFSWVLNVILSITFYLYISAQCLTKLGLNKHRKAAVVCIAVVVFAVTQFVSTMFNMLHTVTMNPYVVLLSAFFLLIVPSVILLADWIRGKEAADEKTV